MRNSLKLALAAGLLAGACATPEPETVDGMPAPAVAIVDRDQVVGDYTLVGYGTVELPFTVERDEVTDCVEEVLEGQLMLMADGAYHYTYVERDTCEGEATEQETETVAGTYSIEEGRLHFDEQAGEDGAEGDLVLEARDLDVGWLDDGKLMIEPEGIDGIALIFERTP